MKLSKTLAIAAALLMGASTFAMAQSNSSLNAKMSGGSGTHQSAQKTGSASNTQKVIKNQNGYRGGPQ